MKFDICDRKSLLDTEVGNGCRVLSFVCILLVILVHTLRLPREWMSSISMCGMDWPTILLNFWVCSKEGRSSLHGLFGRNVGILIRR